MTFTTPTFYLFLPITYLIYYVTPDRFRWVVLLVASYIFYAFLRAPQLLIMLILVTCISYSCGIRIGQTRDEALRKKLLWAGIVSCLILLIASKALPLFVTTLSISRLPGNLLISIGVSYFTFQAIAYLSDIYLEINEPENHFGYHALSLALFPKLLQGPIERAGELLPQLKKSYSFDYEIMRFGMFLFTWGLFKKIVIADRLAPYVNTAYGDVHSSSGLTLVIGTYAYALQLYFDFSGYTDMARGTGRMFGVDLTENFNGPYLATSIADFWRRWHISFSRWILDYIFKPLQMTWRSMGTLGTATALIVTFLISGLWHGVSWGFVVWGLLHGVYLAVSSYYRPYQKRWHKWLGCEKSNWLRIWQIIVTFNLVSFAWIFFRADSLRDALHVLYNIFTMNTIYSRLHESGVSGLIFTDILMGKGSKDFLIICGFLGIYVLIKNLAYAEILTKPFWVRWPVYYFLVFSIVLVNAGDSRFAYFNF